MGYYNKLYKINRDNNKFEKANFKDIFREIQSTFIDHYYLSNLCADTSANTILFSLLLAALDSLKILNTKMNSLEQKFRKFHLLKQNIAGKASNEINTGDLQKETNCDKVANSDAAAALEHCRKVKRIPFISINSLLYDDTNILISEPLDQSFAL